MSTEDKTRVFHGPYDAAGQAWEIAKAERAKGYDSKLILFESNKFGYGSDQSLEIEKSISYVRAIKKGFNFIKILPNYDIFHFYRLRSLLPRYKDLPLIKIFSKKVVMHFFGSEVRRLDVASKHKFHYANDLGFDPEEERKKSKRVESVKKYADVMIVPDYEVLEYVPGAQGVPLTYDADTISKIKTKTNQIFTSILYLKGV